MLARSLLSLLGFVLATGSVATAQTKLHWFHGDGGFDQLGESVAAAGDVNNDGVPDLIAGASRDNSGGGLGYARVWSGADGSVLYTRYGSANADEFGGQVAGAGDVNNDGHDDFIVGSRYYGLGDSTGNAQVFSGADGGLLYTFSVTVSNNFIVGGVAGLGDLNGDGHDDVAVGVAYDNTNGNNSGSVRVFSGADGAELFGVYGAPFEGMGWSVDSAGFVDADAVPDLIIGGDGYGPSDNGIAWVVSGVDGSLIHRFDGDQQFSLFGRFVSGLGDVNGDGRDDVVVAAELYDSGGFTANGRARVYSGLDGSPLWDVAGLAHSHRLGVALDRAGDRNGDGVEDLLVGLTNDFGTYSDNGAVRIFSGVDGAPLEQLLSKIPGDQFGRAAAAAGDIDGDGVMDFVCGAYSGDEAFSNTGSVYVMSLEGDITRYCSSVPNSTGQAAQIHADGAGSLGADDLVLSATGLPPQQIGLMIRGPNEIQAPLGNGFLCIGQAVRTYPLLTSDASGNVTSPLDTGIWPYSSLFQVGATWKFQYWYRDTGAGAGQFNLTDAVSVTFLP